MRHEPAVKKRCKFEKKYTAIDKPIALIEFKLDGTWVFANAICLALAGSGLSDTSQQSHRMVCLLSDIPNSQYKKLWVRWAAGALI